MLRNIDDLLLRSPALKIGARQANYDKTEQGTPMFQLIHSLIITLPEVLILIVACVGAVLWLMEKSGLAALLVIAGCLLTGISLLGGVFGWQFLANIIEFNELTAQMFSLFLSLFRTLGIALILGGAFVGRPAPSRDYLHGK